MDQVDLFKTILNYYENIYGKSCNYTDDDISSFLQYKEKSGWFQNSTNLSKGDLIFKKFPLDFFNYMKNN